MILALFPPRLINESESDIIFDPSQRLTLLCHADGNPTPIYTWTKDGQTISRSTSSSNRETRSIDEHPGALTLNEASVNDQGWYQCNATNILGR